MRIVNRNCKYLLFCITLPAAGHSHALDTPYPLFTYKCDPGADAITVTNALLKADEGASFKYSAENGTYNPWDMVEIVRKPDSTRIGSSTVVTNTCRLSGGEYRVTLEPHIFSNDLNGRCGAAISGAVTVTRDGREVLERTAFEDYCHGNAPIITMIRISGASGESEIKRIPKYRFY